MTAMEISKSAQKIRKMIDKAIKCHEISHEDYDIILTIAYENGALDTHEKALLKQLQSMIEHNDIKLVHTKSCTDENCDCK